MNRMGNLMTKGSCQLLGILNEIQKRIHHVDVPSRCRECIGLCFVHKKKLKGMWVAGLCLTGYCLCDRFQSVIEGRGLDDLPLELQLFVHSLPELGFLVCNGLGDRGLS